MDGKAPANATAPLNGSQARAVEHDAVGQIEYQVATLLRFADGSRRVSAGLSRLERSAYLLLSILTDQGETSVNALADRLGLNASTITRQVDAMAVAGLVERRKHPADGRVTLVTATERGRVELAANRSARHRFYEYLTANWPATDRRELARLLTRLNGELDAAVRAS